MNKTLAAVITGIAVLPALAMAATQAEIQAQAQALLQQVQQLQAQLAAQQGGVVQGGGGGAVINAGTGGVVQVAGTAGVDSSACPQIGRVLKLGTTGDDVSRLQQYLARDPSLYPEATVSGYFGGLTQAAVQRWQIKYNIVGAGTPATTGFGVVGPRTAAAIALLCSTGIGGNGGGASAPVGGYIQVSPVSGNAPLSVNVQATVNTANSCAGAVYTLSWGDNTAPQAIPVSANTCQPISQNYAHVYQYGGTYLVVLSAGEHQTTATVSVYGPAGPGAQLPGVPASSGSTFNVSPITGAFPLSVTFSGTVTGADAGACTSSCNDVLLFGDGSAASVPLPQSGGSQSYTITHTYTGQSTYTATLYQGQVSAGRPPVGTATITVTGQPSLPVMSVTPNFGGNNLALQIQFQTNSNVCGSGVVVNWGDGSTQRTSTNDFACTGGTQSLSHTYAAKGSYTVTLTRGAQVDTAAITISI